RHFYDGVAINILSYFLTVLCAERVGQMTKTYNDIDAVTRLLEEKERDLELAARIGQSLLKKNKSLTERNEFLEEQVEHIREEVSQLRHELSMKDELLQFYTSAACQLKTETITYEEKEQQLVNDCVKELRDANIQIANISEELAKKTEDAARQQEEITHLLSQIVDLQKKAKACAVENEELVQHLGAAKDAQRQLTAELRELEDKYAECMEMLHEAQEELKNLRNKTMPNAVSRRYHSLGLFPMVSRFKEKKKAISGNDQTNVNQLAQPHLGGILDPRPGVVTKGFRTLDLDLDEVYCLNDYEEDETGDISYKGLTTSTPVQHTETSVPHPGKCMSQTNSTFTFTTCRILHPSDELTRVTPSLNAAPTPACGSVSNLKGTPVATPCTPRRLSLAESFTNLRESTTTMSTSLGLVWLLKERGISAAVYNPQSWDRASKGTLLNTYSPKMAIIPSTPPNSPMQTPSSSPPSFEFKCTSPPYDNFLASKPASSILKEVRNKKNIRNSESQTDVSVSNLNLVDKVRRFGIAKVVSSGQAPAPPLTDDQGPLVCGAQGPGRALVPGGLAPDTLPLGCPAVTSAIGGIQLNTGIRRNRSFPTMVGSSMQMKGPTSLTSGILMGTKLPKQTSLR
uniref:Trafficking kinesin protein 1 n=1 Tax=Pavo cristatus TaxID=9049 RepID=A0A8C9EVV7_PAVCR